MTIVKLPDVIWGRPFPKITIDLKKCTVPFLCKKCLQICPTAVFHVARVMSREERLKEMDPRVDGNYVIFASRRDKCTVCNKCIEVCPVDAIKIEVPTVESAKPEVKGKQWGA
jgi:ferredoxin